MVAVMVVHYFFNWLQWGDRLTRSPAKSDDRLEEAWLYPAGSARKCGLGQLPGLNFRAFCVITK